MRIGLDMDEVTAQLLKGFCSFHNDVYGTKLSKNDFLTYSLMDTIRCSEEEGLRRFDTFFRTDYFYEIEPVPGSQKGVSKLLARGDDLFVITARSDIIAKRTHDWAHLHYPNSFSSITLTNQWYGKGKKRKKSEVCKELEIDLMVDDDLTHAYDCAENSIESFLFGNYPWNQKDNLHPLIKRVPSWEELPEEVEKYEKRKRK